MRQPVSMLVIAFFYKEGTWMRWLSFRYDLTSDEGWSSSPWIELGDWTRFLYNNYNFYEGNNIHWEHFYVGIFRCNQVLSSCAFYRNGRDDERTRYWHKLLSCVHCGIFR